MRVMKGRGGKEERDKGDVGESKENTYRKTFYE